MPKVTFIYAHGTAYVLNLLEVGFAIDIGNRVRIGGATPKALSYATIPGLNGQTAVWDGGPENDPFPSMLDPNVWDVVRIRYPASFFPMGNSIDYGAGQVIAAINSLPAGAPYCIGGYSQGAAVMSSVYNEIRYGSLTSRASSFLGGITFGNPRRQLNHRGAVGGTWSGAWDVNGSTTGGHGSFPATGPYARLSACEEKWVDFTAPDDIFSSTGDSTTGTNWTAGNDVLLELAASQFAGAFLSDVLANAIHITGPILGAIDNAFALGNALNTFIDAAGKQFVIGGNGHTTYPFVPPIGDPAGGLTSYQIALTYLEGLAAQWATAPISLPPASVGWSPTLVPPAA